MCNPVIEKLNSVPFAFENVQSRSKVHKSFDIWDYFRVKENVRQRRLHSGPSSLWDRDPHHVGCDQ